MFVKIKNSDGSYTIFKQNGDKFSVVSEDDEKTYADYVEYSQKNEVKIIETGTKPIIIKSDKEIAEEMIANLSYETVMKDLTIQQMQNDLASLTYSLMMKGVL